MTVANVREHEDRDHWEVMFLESARFYRLLKSNPSFGEIIVKLRNAAATGGRVRVVLATPNGDMIEDVRRENG